MVAEVRDDYPNETAALQAVADKLGIGSRETPRNWLKQHEIDAGTRPGTTTKESGARLQDRPFHLLRPQEAPGNSLRPFRAR